MFMPESRYQKIAIIGAGSVATHLGLAITAAGHHISCVFNRSSEKGRILAEKLDTQFTTNLKTLDSPDLIIIAVTDDAIPQVVEQLSNCFFSVVHTSGTVSKEVLKDVGGDYGVFYPLQTFSIGKDIDFAKVPICIEGSDSSFSMNLEELAKSLSHTVCQLDEQKRRILHLAGVFACNFSNWLYVIANDILKKNDIPFELLLPLIQETAMKIQSKTPLDAQTGPARRGDISTIEQHLFLIQNDPQLLNIYKTFTDNILNSYSHQYSTSNFLSKGGD